MKCKTAQNLKCVSLNWLAFFLDERHIQTLSKFIRKVSACKMQILSEPLFPEAYFMNSMKMNYRYMWQVWP